MSEPDQQQTSNEMKPKRRRKTKAENSAELEDRESVPREASADEVEAPQSIRLAVNLSPETARVFRSLIQRKGLSITEGVRRAIAVWRFVEDETARGNKIIVQEPGGTQREVLLL